MLSVGEVKELKVAVAVAIIKSKPRGLPAEVVTCPFCYPNSANMIENLQVFTIIIISNLAKIQHKTYISINTISLLDMKLLQVYTRSVIHRWDNSRLSANEYITSLELERIKLRQKLYLR